MVYLVFTRDGFEEIRARLKPSDVVWMGRSALSSKETEALRGEGIDLRAFDRDIDPADAGAMANWTFTVAERHPGQPMWVEERDEAAEGRRRAHRSLQHWIVAVLLLMSAGYCIVGGVASSRGKEFSDSTEVLWTVAFGALVTLWARNDDRFPISRSKGDSSYLLMFFFWPVVLLNHTVRSRGIEGLVLYLGFLGIFFAPNIVYAAVWVSRML